MTKHRTPQTAIRHEQKNSKPSFTKPIIISIIIIAIFAIAGSAIIIVDSFQRTKTSDNALLSYVGTTKMQELYMKLIGKESVVEFIASDYFDNDTNYAIDVKDDKTGKITYKDSSEYISFIITNDEEDTPDTATDFVLHEEIDGVDTYIVQSSENTYQFFNGGATEEFDNLDDAILNHQLLRE